MQMQNFSYGQPYDGQGYDQGYGQGYAQGYGQGYDPANVEPPQNYGYDPNAVDPVVDDRGGAESGRPLRSQKSFTGPLTEEDRRASMARRRSSMRFQSMNSMRSLKGSNVGNAQDGMARHGSVFQVQRDRNTQASVSMMGAMDDDEMEVEDLRQYYGNMAGRAEERELDGVKAVRSYRGNIEDGDDVGKPRRVTTRGQYGRSATGYGGINFKRDIAMRKGEPWGDLDIRRNVRVSQVSRDIDIPVQQPQPQPMYGAAPMFFAPPPPEDLPAIPHVYSQEDVHTYSNLSDAFADGAIPGNDEDEDEFD